MKKYIFIGIIIFISLFIKVNDYIELNDLKIIKNIKCDDNYYYLTEIIPVRGDNGIEYEKKMYKVKNISNKYFIKYAKNKCNKKG